MVLCRTFHTVPEHGRGRHVLSSIVLVPVPLPVPVPDTVTVITLLSKSVTESMYGNVNKPYEERVLTDKKYGIEYFTYCMIL